MALGLTIFSWAQNSVKEVCFKNGCIKVEVADSVWERAEGIMFRKSLGENQGMLFVLEEEERPRFWMKNMNFPLDIIWIKQDKRVAQISRNATPCTDNCPTFNPSEKVKYVLEVPAGFADSRQVKPGDRLNFRVYP